MKGFAAVIAFLLLAACHESMDEQNRLRTYGDADGLSDWPAEGEALSDPEGTVAQGDADRARQIDERPAVSIALLARGHERYDSFCAPCHGLTGHGDGIVVARGFPAPRSSGAGPDQGHWDRD